MLLSLGVAYILPFELVLVSYAFLGPAHYLTQISWMHDRAYFSGTKWLWVPLVALTGLIIYFSTGLEKKDVIYFLYAGTLAFCFSMGLAQTWKIRSILFLVVLLALSFLYEVWPSSALGFAILLPTVIHIYVFTGLFILLGVMKSSSRYGLLSFIVFLFCGIAFFLISPSDTIISVEFVNRNLGDFDDLSEYLAKIFSFNGNVDSDAMLGFLSFAYTYHYLNWFSKTEVIKWHLIPKARLVFITGIYVVSVGIYLVNFQIGLVVLLFLSVLHVMMEFPLNAFAIKSLIKGLVLKPKRLV